LKREVKRLGTCDLHRRYRHTAREAGVQVWHTPITILIGRSGLKKYVGSGLKKFVGSGL